MSSGRPLATPTLPADSDKTDPNATYPSPDTDASDVDWPLAGQEAETQVFDAAAAARLATEAASTGFVLVVLEGPTAGAKMPLGADEVVVGRSDDAPISIPDVSVSRRHATIAQQDDGSFFVNDLGSGNGTKINGVRVVSGSARHGDEISFGDTVLKLVDEAVPAATSAPKVPIVISGQVGSEAVSTRFDNQKVDSVPAAVATAPAKKPSVAAPGNKRMRLYAIVGVVLVGVFVVAALAKSGGSDASQPTFAPKGSDAGNLFRDAKGLAFNHKWTQAVAKGEEALELSGGDADIENFLEKARVEAEHQRRVEQATEKLDALDFKGASELLAQVPRIADVGPQARDLGLKIEEAIVSTLAQAENLADSDKAQAKSLLALVLDARPDNAAAQALLEELEKPEPEVRVATTKAKRPTVTSTPKPVVKAAPQNSVAKEAYIAGDLKRALQLAEAGGDATSAALAKQINAFGAAYGEGIKLAKEERAAEAVKALSRAVKTDKRITGGTKSKPGSEARKQLAKMEYLLGDYCKGDAELPCASRRFRAAVAADPSHELAAKRLAKVEDRAREIYKEAYIAKGSSPDRAMRLFKISRDSLLPSDEVHQKADRWYKNLGGS